jgi:carbamoyl-phosphate synthase large subunit
MARALRQSEHFSGARLVGTDTCENPFALREGLFDRIYRVPPQSAGAAYENLMLQILREERIDAAVIVPELEVLFWASRRLPVPALLPPPAFAGIAASKERLYECLRQTDLVPRFVTRSREQVLARDIGDFHGVAWLRDCRVGSSSGRGAFLVRSPEEAAAWATLNPAIERFMAAEYLPGRNLACLLLFFEGRLVKAASYERLHYFMARTVPSGISGNISEGRLVDDELARERAVRAVRVLCDLTRETMQGVVTVDLRCDGKDVPFVTEINLRQVAAASAFAYVTRGNISEAQVLATLGRLEEIGPVRFPVPPNNRLLRDIDGVPQFVPDFVPLAVGEHMDAAR